ncbi:hypothetical protein H9Q71_000161 [Fusarium xylarioides]|nr:hypothetical protein H9Q71_000161 [Fusarium xylarioides]
MNESTREKQMITELSEIRKANKELRDGQKRIQDLFVESIERQKEQNELMVNMKKQLDSVQYGHWSVILRGPSMQSKLSQLRQAKEAPTHGGDLQRHPETPTLPDVAVTDSGDAPQSPELGTSHPSTFQLCDPDVSDVWRTAHG